MKRKRIAVIDADAILYAVALSAEMCAKGQGMSGEDMWFNVRELSDCYQDVLARLDEKVEEVEAEDAIICLSHTRCFRYEVLPTYKANRERTRRPPMMIKLRQQIIDRHPFSAVRVVDRLEADDLCGIASTSMIKAPGYEPIVISEDKDLLTVPGYLHQRGHTIEVPLAEADHQHFYQTLTGDVVDNYKGLPGVGAKRAERILAEAEVEDAPHLWAVTLAAFEKHGFNYDFALTQARVARILRCEDWDQSTKGIKLWTPPQ